jgi:hypothetical protein
MNRPTTNSGPRYTHRFQNSVWQVFDTVYYAPVDAKPTEKAAAERAAELNARPPKAKRGPRK